jgi:hypothetical protein
VPRERYWSLHITDDGSPGDQVIWRSGKLTSYALPADVRSARGDDRPTEAIRDSDALAETIASLKPPAVAEEHSAGS